MTFDPVASRLMLLGQLDTLQRGEKVRFLAWQVQASRRHSSLLTNSSVQEYDTSTARLYVHDGAPPTRDDLSIAVDTSNVLESVNHEHVATGAWINIVGYVQHRKLSQRIRASAPADRAAICIEINATMIWSAGAIKLEAYNAAVIELQATINARN